MGNLFSDLGWFTENQNDTPVVEPPLTAEPTSTTVPRPCTAPSSAYPSYDVFISHAGTDKATIAIPLREKLKGKGITSFVDEADMPPGTEAKEAMIHAMETAQVAVIVLSPEFIARKWPMKELMCFLRRRDEVANDGRRAFVLIPLFYRISIPELYKEPCLNRKDKDGQSLYEKSRFYERQRRGEPEANIDAIKSALMTVCGIMGVRNDIDASNDSSYLMSYRRGLLLQKLCDDVRLAVDPHLVNLPSENDINSDGHGQSPYDRFRQFFPRLSSGVQAVLNFDDKDEADKPKTTEGMVKQFLLEDTNDSPRIVSLHGMGGVGKSTILEALSVDDQIRRRFRDGIHVIKLGEDASSATLFRQIYRVLKESGAEKTYESLHTKNDMDETMIFFENWFDGKRCAFFIDDVWEHGIGLALFSRLSNIGSGEGSNSVLLTTREHEIASFADSDKTIELKPREARGRVALDILLFHASHQDTNVSSIHDSINKILDICDGLPVSLAVAGKNVKKMSISMPNDKKGVWKRYLSQLVICREKLLRQNVGRYKNLFTTLATSISCMDEKPQEVTLGFSSSLSFAEMYRRLCVLEKQAIVPISMLKHLWGAESHEFAEVIATAFVEAGLASREAVIVGGEYDHLSLHDSLHDFAAAEAKRADESKDAHNYLLNGYKPSIAQTPCEWWSEELETDGYIHGNVCRHLVEAGCITELLRLLLSPQWVGRQLEVNDILFVQADFSIGMKAIEEGLRDETEEKREDIEKGLELISEAATMSSTFISINGTSKRIELSFQLHGRLIECAKISRAIGDYVDRILTDDRRPRILCKSSLLQQAGESCTRIIPIGVGVYCMATMMDKERIACGCSNGRILVVNLRRNVIEKQWSAHDTYVRAIAVSMDGTRVISASEDTMARVWEVETGRRVTSFTGHSSTIEDIAVMKDGRRVISVSLYERTGNIWDIKTGTLSRLRTNSGIGHVAVLGDEEELVVTGGMDRKLRIWNVTTGEQVGGTFDGHESFVTCIAVTPDGQYIVSGSDDQTVRVWDVRSHEQIGNPLQGHTSLIKCVAISGDGRRLVSASRETIQVWDLETRTQSCDPLEGHTGSVNEVVFLDGADRIVSTSDHTLHVWDVTRKNSKSFTNRHEGPVPGVSFTPNGRFVVSGSYDDTLRVWDTSSGHQLGAPLKGHSYWVADVAVTPNGQCAVSVSYDKTVRVWDLESHKLLRTLTGHTGRVKCVAVSPEGDYIVTGSEDETVCIWALATTESSPVVLEGHSDNVLRVFVSDDGLRVVSVDWDHIFVWELKTKKLVKQVKKEYHIPVYKLSRREVFNLAGESTMQDDTSLSIPRWGRKIFYGEGPSAAVLATVESDISSWALSPDKETFCIGMVNGQVGFLKLETK